MALTNEEKLYLKDGINAIFKGTVSRNRALNYIKDNANFKDVINQLTALLKKDFVAAVSAAGINTPKSAIEASSSDIVRLQSYTGYVAPKYNGEKNTPPPIITENVADSIKEIKKTIGDSTYLKKHSDPTITGWLKKLGADILEILSLSKEQENSIKRVENVIGDSTYLKKHSDPTIIGWLKKLGVEILEILSLSKEQENSIKKIEETLGNATHLQEFQDPTITGGLKELNEKVSEISSLTNIDIPLQAIEISNVAGNREYNITGSAKNVTKCVPNPTPTTFILGDVVATGGTTIIKVLKAIFDCSSWANDKADHYYTVTGDISGCSNLIPQNMAFTECIGALNISFSKIE